MKKIRLGTGFAIFIIFFGIAALDAIQTQYWPRIIFWVVVGSIFIISDNLRKAQ